ncbi:MAG: polyprenol monophosphomannose synthase [Deltaproteobacteria bacterium]|uniref:Polyprenol monophosphomannose synthase n=1 Tax=Candidatus Zymogenus saltonus TaxID=2844893 RepID=A0A9D8KG05_9DELT|nr:polyprenol monophosphomannose synthase [Candidatus Zymogenus saltonus]
MKTAIMIPTYNEAENIESLIDEVLSIADDIGVVVVDDNSPDGTAEAVRNMGDRDGRIHLLVRTGRRGRGTAGIEGFKYALGLGPELSAVGEMDADFSHDPKYLKDFLKEIKKYDIVIGSRAAFGGGEEGRSLVRRAITSFAAFYIRMTTGIEVGDPTSGYRLFRREVVEAMDLDGMISTGPSIVQEMLYRALKAGFTFTEVPILFSDRRAGEPKFNWKIGIESLIMMLKFRVRYGKLKR